MTHAFSWLFSFVAPATLGLLVGVFAWQSAPGWRQEGEGYITGSSDSSFSCSGAGGGKSWLAGGLVLAMSMLPTVTVVLIERLAAVPAKYLEASAALGLRPSQIVWAVLMRQSWGGLITGSLLGLARAAGETAPIMFCATIFTGATFPKAIAESPVLTLPYHIFILAQDSFDPAVGAKLWSTALVLLGLVFSLSLAALPSRLRIHEEANV